MIKTVKITIEDMLDLPELDKYSDNGNLCSVEDVAKRYFEYLKRNPNVIDYSERIPCDDVECGFVTVGEFLAV